MIFISYFIAGMLLGLILGGLVVAVYGDDELNESVRKLRKGRLDMHLAKTKYLMTKMKIGLLQDHRRILERATRRPK